ncbi:DUF4386 family protein [Georgenia sp. M64]|uniref:DUF4386 family protein n=1 Tax=Georgenia sp. M64 TaxID=3120520 RepID=UPI0030DF01F3
MNHLTSPAVRWTVALALALALAGVTTVVSILLMPDFSGTHADWLAEIAGDPGTAAVSAHLFAFSQLLVAVGVVGVAVQVFPRPPRLAFLAAALVVLQAFGHAAHAGFNAVILAMAAGAGDATTHVELLERTEAGLLPYMALGLIGTVLGLILLGAALLRAGYGPRWLGVVLIAFVVVEFGLSGLSMWAGYLAGALFLVAFLAMAVLTVRGADDAAHVPATQQAVARTAS